MTHPGNIGAAARAMKTMGLSKMCLVQPKQFPNADATARACGADDILFNAQVFDSYEESLKDYSLVFGASARQRMITWPVLTPTACAEQTLQIQAPVAIVFGRENSGLTNKELEHCNYLVQIPTDENFSSLNVAAAVQIIAYELRMAEFKHNSLASSSLPTPVSAETMEQLYQHLEHTLIDINFLNPNQPRLLMRRLRRLFNRSQLIDSEVNILRGILTAMQEKHKM
ncbi:RNA methyltransferase [Thiotrichales bacterium HSG1]|nr:RNA methyltransferase [Thiotrichales bacterium HSG1]